MRECIEHDMSMVAKMYALPLGTLTYPAPIYVGQKFMKDIPASTLKDEYLLFLNSKTIKCNEKPDISVAHRIHTMSVVWETEPTDMSDYSRLMELERTPHELAVIYIGGQIRVIRTDADGYMFVYDESDGKCTCSMTLTNGQGFTIVSR